MQERIERIAKILENIVLYLGAGGMIISIAVGFLGVILRYIFNISFEWMEEVARYAILLATFLTFGALMRNKGHVAMDLLTINLEGRAKEIHRLIVGIITGLFAIPMFVWGIDMVQMAKEMGLITASQEFSQWMINIIFPLGMLLVIAFSVLEIISAITALRRLSVEQAQSPKMTKEVSECS